MARTSRLTKEKETLERNEVEAEEFIRRYQLADRQAEVLRGGAVSEEFFAALERAQEIHAECKALIQSGQGRSRADLSRGRRAKNWKRALFQSTYLPFDYILSYNSYILLIGFCSNH